MMLLITFSLFVLLTYLIWPKTAHYEWRQVRLVPPSEVASNFLLPITPHIRHTKRPDEHFSFPVALGDIGPVKPLYSGNLQYPFYCQSLDSGLPQPQVDNQEGWGVEVRENNDGSGKLLGYSKDCSVPSQLSYLIPIGDDKFTAISEADAKQHKGLLLRAEQGTINRFIYTLLMPITVDEIGNRLAKSLWNQRLVYQFRGGGGIGHRQGKQSAGRVAKRMTQQFEEGYAIISSSGNQTSHTYNMLLAEDTARRVKKQFVSLYGEPLYTVGIGGSGGGLAQYLIAQNSEGILDALLPLYSYPDMISQTIYALDCDLLNNYFTFNAGQFERWQRWDQRRLIEGTNTKSGQAHQLAFLQPLNQLMAGLVPSMPKGNTECINGWFAQSAFINNPQQGFLRPYYSESVAKEAHWSYWQDMVWLLGKDEHDYARSTWDNVGVQYGLVALKNGDIGLDEFIHLNQHIGSWKPAHQMEEEDVWIAAGKLPIWFTLWSNHNIQDSEPVAPRTEASIEAINAAYRGGQVFLGNVDLPILDIRHYLDHKLDMHHLAASFNARQRITKANGHSDNQVIWVADEAHYPVNQAFKLMDEWLLNIAENPQLSVADTKPRVLKDQCFDENGDSIAQGSNVWDGDWNNKPDEPGACHRHFPAFTNSRIQAGATWLGDTFKCHLITVETALKRGLYEGVDVSGHLAELKRIYPKGVCDYSQGDIGRPSDI